VSSVWAQRCKFFQKNLTQIDPIIINSKKKKIIKKNNSEILPPPPLNLALVASFSAEKC
jgi:hypothetical protein